MRDLLIDTDTASDDAVALIMALRCEDVAVRAITVVAGNVSLEQGSRNARYVVELCGADVPVHEGAARPLLREPHTAHWFHGRDGLSDRNYPAPKQGPASRDAALAMVAAARDHEGLTVVTLGPLTNLALALRADPSLAQRVHRCVVMGGAANVVGNVTPAAEYNIWCDPEAAREVLRSGMNVELVGWEHCRGPALFDAHDIAAVRALDTPLAHFAIDCNETARKANLALFSEDGIGLPDPVAMAIALDPSITKRSSKHAVEIECAGELTRGMTVVDQLDVIRRGLAEQSGWPASSAGAAPNVSVCWEIDVPRFKRAVLSALGHPPSEGARQARR